ncbi:MAG TPA: hypothetical protein VD767_00260 [Thermomicrobiales bacterium]|nr:hypothetical protein [Thermomicrobiales bacterium]
MESPEINHQTDSTREESPLWRRIGTWTLLVIFCIGLVASIASVWLRVEVLDTDAYVDTVAPLASDPDVQQAIADRVIFLLDQRMQQEDARIEIDGLVRGMAFAAVLDLVHRVVLDVVESDDFQQFWIAANREVHQRSIDALTGESDGALFLENGQLTLDLNPLIAQVDARLQSRGLAIFDRIQVDPAQATFVIFESDAARKAERGIELVETLSIVLPLVTIIALAGCLLMADRRWRMMAWIGIGAAVSMILLLVVLSVLRERYLDGLGAGRSVDANEAALDIFFRAFHKAVRVTAGIGLVVAAFAAVISSDFIRQPRVIEFISRYRNGLVGAIVGIACLGLVVADQLSYGMAIGIGLVVLAIIMLLVWISRISVPRALAKEAVS